MEPATTNCAAHRDYNRVGYTVVAKCQLRDVYYPIHNASIANLSVVAVRVSVPQVRCWLIPVHHYPVRYVTKEM